MKVSKENGENQQVILTIEASAEDWNKAIYSRLDAAGTPEELAAREAEIRREVARAAASIRRRKGWG